MMKKKGLLWMAAAVMMCCGCLKEQPVEKMETPRSEKVWNVTVEAAKATDPDTKALIHETESGRESLSFEWLGTEILHVYKGDVQVGELTTSGGSNTCVFRGTLTGDNYQVGEELTLKYLLGNVSDPARLYTGQKGTIEDISTRFDYARATVKVKFVNTEESNLVLSSAKLENCQSITKFTFSYTDQENNPIRKLTVTSSALPHPVTVTPEGPMTSFYVAIPGDENAYEKKPYDFTAETLYGIVFTGTLKAQLENGKFYKAPTRTLAEYNAIGQPLTIEALRNGVVTIKNPLKRMLTWGFDDASVSGQRSNRALITIDIAAGQKLKLGGYDITSDNAWWSSDDQYANISCNVEHYVYGNVMSLISTSFASGSSLTRTAYKNAFRRLFHANHKLYNHPVKDIELPATKVYAGAYAGMFSSCTNLTRAPELPATTLANNPGESYQTGSSYDAPFAPYLEMFALCTNLKKAPSILPADRVPAGSYYGMFRNCTSLEASPVLPAEIPQDKAYKEMFDGCSSLRQIICYAKHNMGEVATPNWVRGVSSSGMFISNPLSDTWPVGNNGIPSGWNDQEVKPLTIEALEDGQVIVNNPQHLTIKIGKSESMASAVEYNDDPIVVDVGAGEKVRFWGDNPAYGHDSDMWLYSKIKYTGSHYMYGDVRSLVSSGDYTNVTTLQPYAFKDLFSASEHMKSHPTEPLILGATTLGQGCYETMFALCTALERAPALPATTLGSQCYSAMFMGCTSLTSAPFLPATTLAEGCYTAMFYGCASLESAPALPATTLASGCYINMFANCVNLKFGPNLMAPQLVPDCYSYMFYDCSQLIYLRCHAENPAEQYTEEWLKGTHRMGTFYKKEGVDWARNVSGIPNGWLVASE